MITEKEAQELVDHMVMKFRMVKFARIESYNQLFSGDPVWATLEVSFNINIKECGNTSNTHCSTVLGLDRSKISKVQPLECLMSILCRL